MLSLVKNLKTCNRVLGKPIMELINVLVWFSCHRDYFRFRIPELVSLLSLQNCSCLVERSSQGMSKEASKYREKVFLLSLEKIPQYFVNKEDQNDIQMGQDQDVYVVLKLPKESFELSIKPILCRSVLIKGFIEVRHPPVFTVHFHWCSALGKRNEL